MENWERDCGRETEIRKEGVGVGCPRIQRKNWFEPKQTRTQSVSAVFGLFPEKLSFGLFCLFRSSSTWHKGRHVQVQQSKSWRQTLSGAIQRHTYRCSTSTYTVDRHVQVQHRFLQTDTSRYSTTALLDRQVLVRKRLLYTDTSRCSTRYCRPYTAQGQQASVENIRQGAAHAAPEQTTDSSMAAQTSAQGQQRLL